MTARALETDRTSAGPTSAAPMPAATGPRKSAKPSATDDSEFAETRSPGVRDSIGIEAKWKGRTTATAIVASAEQVTTTGTGADTRIARVVAAVADRDRPVRQHEGGTARQPVAQAHQRRTEEGCGDQLDDGDDADEADAARVVRVEDDRHPDGDVDDVVDAVRDDHAPQAAARAQDAERCRHLHHRLTSSPSPDSGASP